MKLLAVLAATARCASQKFVQVSSCLQSPRNHHIEYPCDEKTS